jgi:hypothetical protein
MVDAWRETVPMEGGAGPDRILVDTYDDPVGAAVPAQ